MMKTTAATEYELHLLATKTNYELRSMAARASMHERDRFADRSAKCLPPRFFAALSLREKGLI